MTTTATIAHSRTGKPIARINRWRSMDIDNPPQACGVYAIKSGKQWMYIGRSVSIKTRIKTLCHPAQIMRTMESLNLSYWWHPVERSMLARTELFLIEKYSPEWNGGTQFDALHYPPYPSCGILLPLSEQEKKRLRDAFCVVGSVLLGEA